MKRLNNEVNNTPGKPNAFNLPKCPTKPPPATNPKLPTKVQAKLNGNVYNVRITTNDDSKDHSNGHFVSSSQAKAASTMGIINYGSVYSSVVAAANRGCLNSKFSYPYPPPQAVVPKTFPVSGVAGGEVGAGGNTVIHPPPPPGLVALSPQNVGLALPFQKFYSAEQQGIYQRRAINYVVQDPCQVFHRSPGICKQLQQQQRESGFFVCSYTSSTSVAANNPCNNVITNPPPLCSIVSPRSDSNCDESVAGLRKISAVGQNANSFHSILNRYQKKQSYTKQSTNSPFVNKLSENKGKRFWSANETTTETPRWGELIRQPKRSQTTNPKTNRTKSNLKPRSPLPVLKLFSLRHRHAKSLSKNRICSLAITCPST